MARFKINDKINIPNELDLNNYLANYVREAEDYDSKDYIYELKSIACHYGDQLNSGHYKGNLFSIAVKLQLKF